MSQRFCYWFEFPSDKEVLELANGPGNPVWRILRSKRLKTKKETIDNVRSILGQDRQLTIDFSDIVEESIDIEGGAIERKISYNSIPASEATFKAGLDAPVHRWFRLTPSFSPGLVREMLTTLKCDLGDVVLDPFSGAGTTIIETQLRGLTSYGFEINPFLCFVSNTSLNWNLNASNLGETLSLICNQFCAKDSLVSDDLEKCGLTIPKIHNPTRWWRSDILKQLLVLKSCIESLSCVSERDFFLLALAGVLVPDLTNVTLGKLQLHFIDRTHDKIQVLPTFVSHAKNMINDLDKINRLSFKQTSKVFLADSVNIRNLKLHKPVKCVITSPPYPNRYSYVWNTRPYLYLFDFFSVPKQAADLDKKTIGGTWGSATSALAKGRLPPENKIVCEVAGPVVESIRQTDNLMANYVMKYFNLIAKQITEMEELLTEDARLAYVVGCSRIKGIYVETDVMLGRIMEGLGYKVSAVERIRKRNSGKNLHEAIVYAWRRKK